MRRTAPNRRHFLLNRVRPFAGRRRQGCDPLGHVSTLPRAFGLGGFRLLRRQILSTVCWGLAVWASWQFTSPVLAQRSLTDIPDPDPVAELAAMTVAEGYEVNLFASDPMIRKPLQINFDPQGRLWVSSSSVYPQIRPGEVANDTVTILEDRDGDGRADVRTLFADGLLMPTAVLPGDGGAYVANSTELLHLSDSDGDGKADRRRVVLSGFGAEDTHHIIHTFRWGPDARFYFNQSIYIHSHVETPAGVRRLNGGGIWRFRPEWLTLDVFARGWVNTWGHAFDAWGRSLVTDGAGGEGIYYGFPGAAYQAAVGTPRILHGMNPGSPKYCGLEIIDGGHLPPDAQGLLVTNDFRGNRVCRFRLSESGSGFTSEKLADLIHSQRVTFRPIDVKMGPDGAIYIADWYNPIIQHGEVDFRDARRDREHGRIWRVTAKGRPLVKRSSPVERSTVELLSDLGSEEGYTRDMARRVLWTRDPQAVRAAVPTWLTGLDRGATGFERLRLEGLRLIQAVVSGLPGDIDRSLLEAVLTSPEPRARAAAARIVADWAGRLEDPVALLAPTVDDTSLLVRLEGVRALSAIGGRRAAELVLHAVDYERDDALDYAIWLAVRELRGDWLPAAIDGSLVDDGKPARILFAITAAGAGEAIPQVVKLLSSSGLQTADRQAALDCVARFGGSDALRLPFEAAMNPSTTAERSSELLRLLLESHAQRRVLPAGDLTGLTRLVQEARVPLAQRALEAVAAWQVGEAADAVARIARDSMRQLPLRKAAVAALGQLSGDMPRDVLRLLAAADGPPELRADAAIGLMTRHTGEAAEATVQMLGESGEPAVWSRLFKAFLTQRGAADRLAEALLRASRPLTAGAAEAGLKELRGSGRSEPALAAALEKIAGQAAPAATARPLNAEEMAAFLRFTESAGDPSRGRDIYRREQLRCVTCHRIEREGGRVGPNLTTIGVSSPLDYIVTSLLDPAKNVKEGYNTLVVLTADGRVETGIPVSRTDDELVLRNAADKEIRIRTVDIEEESAGTSLMPIGLVDGLSRQELADLVRYLATLGR